MTTSPEWRTSSFSSNQGNCVAIATPDPSTTLIRNSQHPDCGTLCLPTATVADFVAACRAGELDDLAG
jgi:hypothetical protein